MFNLALGIFVFLSPIVVLLGSNARWNGEIMALQYYQFKTLSSANDILQYQFFQYGVLGLFLIALMQRPRRAFKDTALACLLGFCIWGVVIHPKYLSAFVPVFLGALLYYLVVGYTRNTRRLLWVIFAVSAANTLFAVLQIFNLNFLYNSEGGIKGLMCISNQLGFYQALSVPISFALNPWLIVVPIIGLLISKSFLALFATLIGMSYYLYPKKDKIIRRLAPMGFIMVTAVLGVFFLWNYNAIVYKLSVRSWIWVETLEAIMDNPVIGHAIGRFQFDRATIGTYTNPYNIYLQITFFLGFTGLICFAAFLKDKFVHYYRSSSRAIFASCIILLVIGVGFCFMDYARLAGTAIVLFGLLAVAKTEDQLEN